MSFKKQFVLWLTVVVTVLSLAWASFESHTYYSDIVYKQEVFAESAREHTRALANEDLHSMLSPMPILAKKIVDELQKKSWTQAELELFLKKTLQLQTGHYGLGVAFEPYAFDQNIRLYAPLYLRHDNAIQQFNIADYYDYTSDNDWYRKDISVAGAWNHIRQYKVNDDWLIEYLSPIYHQNEFVGVVVVNLQLEWLHNVIEAADFGERSYGYGLIVDHQGRLVDYPEEEKVMEGKSIEDVEGLSFIQALAISQYKGIPESYFLSALTKKRSWLFREDIPDTPWVVMAVFESPNYFPEAKAEKEKLIKIIIAWSVFLFFFSCVFLAYRSHQKLSVYVFGISLCSIAFTAAIVVMWYISLYAELGVEEKKAQILNVSDLTSFKRSYSEKSIQRGEPAIYVPTGVFIQSIEFSTANNVIVTGYIWQKYHERAHRGLSREVVMPEAETFETKPAYSKPEGRHQLIGWYFRATLRQNFEYEDYPLDRQSVWLRLWHKDFDQNVVLVPDLKAYDELTPDSLPGLEEDFVLSGWDLWQSFYQHNPHSYNTNFGIDNYVGQTEFPELYFYVSLKRDFFGPFISQLAPMFVVILMLFAILVTSSKGEKRNTLLGFNTAGVLASNSALFFVVLVSHIDLRSSLAAKEILYLESFYFVIYLALLVISVNSILFSWGVRFPEIKGVSLIQYRDNLIPKLLFWPMVTGQLLLCTLIFLYPE